MKRGAAYLAGATALAVASWPLGALWAQVAEEDGGARLVADLDMRLELDDGETTFRTGVDIDLISATRTQRLSFSTDVGLELDLSDFDTSWTDPRYQLDYLRDNGQSRLTASVLYQTRDVDGQILDLSTEFDETDLIEDDGTRESRQLNLGFEFGLQDPFGGSISYSYSDTIFSGTSDPDLFDSTVTSLSGTLRFDIDPTLRLTLDGSTQVSEEANATSDDTTTNRLGLAATWQIRPDISLDGRLGYSRIEQDQVILGFPVTTVTEGGEARLAATFDRPNGSLGVSWDSTLNTLGRLNTVELTRDFALPRGRNISGSLGQTFLPTGLDFTIGSLSYTQETQTGRIRLAVQRSAAVSSLDQEVVRTSLSAGYSAELPSNASWSLSGNFVDSDFVNPASTDQQSSSLSLNYNHPLTADWDLATGLSWSSSREDGGSASDRSTLFVTLQRTFSVRR